MSENSMMTTTEAKTLKYGDVVRYGAAELLAAAVRNAEDRREGAIDIGIVKRALWLLMGQIAPADGAVAICGACGLRVLPVMGYSCSRIDCPIFPVVTCATAT